MQPARFGVEGDMGNNYGVEEVGFLQGVDAGLRAKLHRFSIPIPARLKALPGRDWITSGEP
jgi:hypothetical protein